MFFCISVYLYGLGVRGLGSHICALCIYPVKIICTPSCVLSIVFSSKLWYNTARIGWRQSCLQTYSREMGKTMEERLDYFSSYNEDELYDMALRDNWERPEPLFDEADAPPDFPVFALPEDLAEYVTALANSTQDAGGDGGLAGAGGAGVRVPGTVRHRDYARLDRAAQPLTSRPWRGRESARAR